MAYNLKSKNNLVLKKINKVIPTMGFSNSIED